MHFISDWTLPKTILRRILYWVSPTHLSFWILSCEYIKCMYMHAWSTGVTHTVCAMIFVWFNVRGFRGLAAICEASVMLSVELCDWFCFFVTNSLPESSNEKTSLATFFNFVLYNSQYQHSLHSANRKCESHRRRYRRMEHSCKSVNVCMKEGEGSKIMLMTDFIRIPRVGFKYIVETWFK